jgi:CheY-like chemotaxis protein
MARPIVLVVDDNALIGRQIKDLLEPHGYMVYRAEKPSVGMLHLERSPEIPSVVIVDYYMPEMTGVDFVKKVRALRRKEAADVHIIGLSGEDRDHKVQMEFAKAGITIFLTKPVSEESLLSAVQFLTD